MSNNRHYVDLGHAHAGFHPLGGRSHDLTSTFNIIGVGIGVGVAMKAMIDAALKCSIKPDEK